MDAKKLKKTLGILLAHKTDIKDQYEFPGTSQIFKIDSANQFFLGAIMDYQMDANKVWGNAKKLADKLGRIDIWHEINKIPEERFLKLRMDDGTYFHRFWEAKGQRSVARRIQRISKNVVNKFNGDVRNIWSGKPAEQVREILIHDIRINLGNTSAIVDMIVLALVDAGIVKGISDVKADIYVKRVLGRVFNGKPLRRDKEAIDLARAIHPDNTSEIDLPLFDIGKELCKKSLPSCNDCPLGEICLYKSKYWTVQ